MAEGNRGVVSLRRLFQISFNGALSPWPQLKDLFERAGLPEKAAEGPDPTGFYTVRILDGDESLDRLKSGLRRMGIKWLELEEREYSAEELLAAPLLNLRVTTAERGDTWAKYDWAGACSRCGTGALQISPLGVNLVDIPKKVQIFQTKAREFLVLSPLADILSSMSLSGGELREVVSRKDGRPLPWFQITPLAELPPWSALTSGVERENPCRVCRRDGYFHSRRSLEIVYDGPLHVHDLMMTWEHFGNSYRGDSEEESRPATPLLLVSTKVYQAFEAAKVSNVEWSPVRVLKQ